MSTKGPEVNPYNISNDQYPDELLVLSRNFIEKHDRCERDS